MPAAITTGIKELAYQAWAGLPDDKRSYKDVLAALKRAGIKDLPSKGSITRWKRKWKVDKPVIKEAVGRFMPALADALSPPDEHFVGIPASMQEELTQQLISIGKGEGLAKVEDAIGQLAAEIGKDLPRIKDMLLTPDTEEITEDGDGAKVTKRVRTADCAQNAINALARLASAMATLTSARVMPSGGFHGLGAGSKLNAEGIAVLEGSRINNATDITPGSNRTVDGGMSAEDEAKLILAGTLTTPPPRAK